RRRVGLTVRENDFQALNCEAVFLDQVVFLDQAVFPDQEATLPSSNITITSNEVVDTRALDPRDPDGGLDLPPLPDGSFYGGLGVLVNHVSGLTFPGNPGRHIPKNLLKASNRSKRRRPKNLSQN